MKKRIQIDLDEKILKKAEERGKSEHRKRKQEIESIVEKELGD